MKVMQGWLPVQKGTKEKGKGAGPGCCWVCGCAVQPTQDGASAHRHGVPGHCLTKNPNCTPQNQQRVGTDCSSITALTPRPPVQPPPQHPRHFSICFGMLATRAKNQATNNDLLLFFQTTSATYTVTVLRMVGKQALARTSGEIDGLVLDRYECNYRLFEKKIVSSTPPPFVVVVVVLVNLLHPILLLRHRLLFFAWSPSHASLQIDDHHATPSLVGCLW